jgi:3-methylcrotonyl-CoA carboxylase alpha subunit
VFHKILIANRGEIACRIARTCKRLGVAVAGIHSSADAGALHVRIIGESIEIGAAPAADSYLRIDAVLAAAKATGAQAIHPGFGFLAENAAFARAVEAAGLIFIGPTPETIERLGDKASAKKEAAAAAVPTIPGSMAGSEDAATIERTVRELGLPVMLKAGAGGGGKGMRVITAFGGLAADIESAMREARGAFGHAGLIVEKLVERGRHIEVQIAGDGKGNVVHLFERECSLQRRHQKLIEEAPAANLPPELRDRMLDDAVRLGQKLRYRGVGTVEFIVTDAAYYFLEVNPRLQVEHPVTEMVTGIDIVELMLRIAAGDGLPFSQSAVHCGGHAVEARICAEDAAANFMPSTGELAFVEFPDHGIRVETGIESGSAVTPYYDSMLAKLIAHAITRGEALDKLDKALGDTTIFGLVTNLDFLRRLIALPATRDATFHTRLIDEHINELIKPDGEADVEVLAVAACFWLMEQRPRTSGNPWKARELTGWQLTSGGDRLSPIPILHLESQGGSAEIRFGPLEADGAMLIGVNEQPIRIRLIPHHGNQYLAVIGAQHDAVRIQQQGRVIFVKRQGRTLAMTAVPYLTHVSASAQTSAELRAPMTGMVLKVNVAAGDQVKTGDVAVVIESMKMELRIVSEIDGVVAAIRCNAGETIERNAIVAVIDPRQP